MNGPLRLVVFDMDGTLIDSAEMIYTAMHRAFGSEGLSLPGRAQVLSVIGLSLDAAFTRLMPGGEADTVTRLVARYREAFVSLREERGGEAASPLYPGARAALQALHAMDEVLMGVATGKARRGLDHACRAHDLGPFFTTLQCADGHPSKPNPSMLLAALAEAGAEAEHAVMIGDTSYDIRMGRAAGFRTIGVSWGYHPVEALHAAGADRVIGDYAGLVPALNGIWRETA